MAATLRELRGRIRSAGSIKKITKAPMAGSQYHADTNESQLVHACWFAIARVDNVPECTSTPTIARPSAAS